MSRIEDGGAVEAGLDLVAELVSLSELDRLGGFWASARIHRRAADRLASDAAEITRLRAENAGMREALEFYGDPAGWNQPPVKTYEGLISVEYENQASKIQKDRGRVARAALSKASQAEGQTP